MCMNSQNIYPIYYTCICTHISIFEVRGMGQYGLLIILSEELALLIVEFDHIRQILGVLVNNSLRE